MTLHQRNITQNVLDALQDTPVVLINGARQTGKSTLVKSLSEGRHTAHYLNLDNASTLAAALSDPSHFIENFTQSIIVDEIQRAPSLLLAIKESVDKDRRPGRFLLTGSANVLLLPQVSDSLAGRMQIINLWPLSQGELLERKENFIETLFTKKAIFSSTKPLTRDLIIDRVIHGGYPEALTRTSENRKQAWFESYITAILQRDIREIANIEGLLHLPKLLSLLAARIGGLLNIAEISRTSEIAQTTLSRYMTLLQTIFLIFPLPAWSSNLSKRIVKSPKLYFCDTGLAAHLMGLSSSRFINEPILLGPLLENFVVLEILKQLGWSQTPAKIYHYRTTAGQEVDIVLESNSGNCVGIEVKSSSSVSAQDFKGLHHLAEHIGDQFIRGIVLYNGDQVLSFGKELYAIPISYLWQ